MTASAPDPCTPGIAGSGLLGDGVRTPRRFTGSCAAPPATVRAGGFDIALTGTHAHLCTDDDRIVALGVPRWHQRPDACDEWLLRRCHGATLDIGCGPGRLLTALLDRGVTALGVDNSPHAGQACAAHPDTVLRQDIFDPLPGEGLWDTAILADGNIGIGGQPAALLHRCTQLLRPGGTILIELDPPGTGIWHGHAHLRHPGPPPRTGPWFPWAQVALDHLHHLTNHLGLRIHTQHHGPRYFAHLHTPSGHPSMT